MERDTSLDSGCSLAMQALTNGRVGLFLEAISTLAVSAEHGSEEWANTVARRLLDELSREAVVSGRCVYPTVIAKVYGIEVDMKQFTSHDGEVVFRYRVYVKGGKTLGVGYAESPFTAWQGAYACITERYQADDIPAPEEVSP